ncbi:MAG TPA: Dabb family protein [Opitutaceae bacterium]
MLIHSVYFWLKAGLKPAERSHFKAEVNKLAAVGSVTKAYVGEPAHIAERSVTDRSFDVALTIVFADGAAHDAYQVDPIHLAFVDGNRESWAKVQVYDSEG